MKNDNRDAAVQAAVNALIKADYQLPDDWFNQSVTCSDTDCHVKSRGGAHFSAIAGSKIGEPLNWAFSLRVGTVPGEEGTVAVVCQHCRNLAFHALCDGKAKELGLDTVMPRDPTDEVRAKIEANHQTVREAVGMVFVPLVAVCKAYQNRLEAEEAVRTSPNPSVEMKVQQQLDQPTECAVSGVQIPRLRDARVVNADAIKACIVQAQTWLKQHPSTDPEYPKVQERLQLAQRIFAKVIDRPLNAPIRFVSREVAKMIGDVIGPQTIYQHGQPKEIWPIRRPDSLVRLVLSRQAENVDRTAAKLGEFLDQESTKSPAESSQTEPETEQRGQRPGRGWAFRQNGGKDRCGRRGDDRRQHRGREQRETSSTTGTGLRY